MVALVQPVILAHLHSQLILGYPVVGGNGLVVVSVFASNRQFALPSLLIGIHNVNMCNCPASRLTSVLDHAQPVFDVVMLQNGYRGVF